MMRVSVIGAGYVGLVTGVCLAEKGHDVVCVERDAEKRARLARGEATIHEEGLQALLTRHAGNRFRVSASIADAVACTDLTLIAVGTPFDGRAIDLSQVLDACEEIGAALAGKREYHVIVVKSTVVPGTTTGPVRERLESASRRHAGADFGLGANPEFLTEGQAVADFMAPDRIVVGGIDTRSTEVLAALYDGFAGVPLIRTNPSTAELIKYASNALLATMISFSNEIADLASAVGDIDARDVMAGVHASAYLTIRDGDRRLRAPITSFLEAGCGFGGSCLPKDVSALVAQGKSRDLEMGVLDAVLRVNQGRPEHVLKQIRAHFPSLRDRRIAVLGLAFKPDTDDVRESPAFPILRGLIAAGATVTVYDPVALDAARPTLAGTPVLLCRSLGEAIAGVDAIVIVTRWGQFDALPRLLAGVSPAPLVFDARRMLDRESVTRYDGIGL